MKGEGGNEGRRKSKEGEVGKVKGEDRDEERIE